jgi:hypothetical protein
LPVNFGDKVAWSQIRVRGRAALVHIRDDHALVVFIQIVLFGVTGR